MIPVGTLFRPSGRPTFPSGARRRWALGRGSVPVFLAAGLGLGLALGILGACRKSTPEAPPEQKAKLSPREVELGGKWLFTYADPEGLFATTDDAEAIPPASRGLVRVIDPSAADKGTPGTAVHVLDANELLRRGKTTAKPLSREAFETAALAQLPSAYSNYPGVAGERARAGEEPVTEAPPPPGGKALVTLYGTSWCGVCKKAREYLRARKIPFYDKDIEKDPAAARELQAKAARLGVPADRVPILDVRGRLLVGFEPRRLEALLGEAS